MALVAEGLMTRRDGASLPFGGMDLFHATDAGRTYVAAHSPAPPKLTRGQRRYQAWLDADSSLSFIDYLRTSSVRLSGAAA
ncbi:hypothetical protein [Sphingomonas sp. 1P08PE]|uniref:hypothetical protein n=1 Tax=Sphingomonas sp. 1P08PE TaxID=554122 RepID=UPI0039A35D43